MLGNRDDEYDDDDDDDDEWKNIVLNCLYIIHMQLIKCIKCSGNSQKNVSRVTHYVFTC